MYLDSRTEMTKRKFDQLTPGEAKLMKWFTTKGSSEPEESKDEEKAVGGAVIEMITEK